jgi:hypothetical protein
MDSDVSKDRYASSNVTLENCNAFYVHLEPLEGLRTQFMFWRGDRMPAGLKIFKRRMRDLRPGDQIVYNGMRRKVATVQIYR